MTPPRTMAVEASGRAPGIAGAWLGDGRPLPVSEGNAIRILEAACRAIRSGGRAALAVVLETQGSTYAGTGTMALFGEDGHVGWLSGGCMEPEIVRRAEVAVERGAVEWLEIDTRDDAALFAGAAVGCRGCLRIALLPLHGLAGLEPLLAAWLGGQQQITLRVSAGGSVAMETSSQREEWRLPAGPVAWAGASSHAWTVTLPRPPEALVLGVGPETPVLVPLLRELGWRVRIAEHRPKWRAAMAAEGQAIDATPTRALAQATGVDAAVVMHHDFELDREALDALAASPIPFVGLLGPVRRQEDLFKLLRREQRAALLPRLHSPVGLDLGGRGPEAIALSVAAQLQAWRHGGA